MTASSPPPDALWTRDFACYQAARVLFVTGAQMQSVAVAWHVYERTRRALDLGYVGLALFLPAIGFSLVAGHVADHFDRRKVVLLCQSLQVVAALALYALSRDHGQAVWPIYTVLFCVGTARAFAGPAHQALVPDLVGRDRLARALSWSSSLWQLSTIAGPSIGGLVYGAAHSAGAVYLAQCVLTAIGIALTAQVRSRGAAVKERGSGWGALLAGVRYVRENRLLLGAISLDLFAVLLGGAVALLPVFAREVLAVGPSGLGVLRAAPSLGAAAVAIALAYFPLRRHTGPIMLLSVALFGVATIGFGLSRNYALSTFFLALSGAADMVSVVVRQTLVQVATPREMRGRVGAVTMVFVGASNELGEFESGLTAAWLGAVQAVVLGGVGTLIVVALWSLLFKELARVDRLDDSTRAAS